ncbi:MAG TPA: CRISPR-associated protein [Cyanobacteria bacterium UBA11149]|nr:CRISPR-associated protein [Cyanobacteria bacterium UBA11367]HBE59458.1 CRISPR-associated protein [Cyanobacteria bacterium UBA11366]HBK65310.1 CRISPR-associated protein [Cyanobacteria bacterium UBA11166]HBR73757.1 CRISPR-associated protein [Cyanobacteria bacterium UBA11159]HBS68821.1 CRISPR-associated protein [Cyanobacteria bacterium UBA11153]HBW88657.1 CRISPR-associated protein [Cyanobacteria bacterium UBA11149]HCA96114.1 CRISPR-associated protein [Cyanobacteria bacterium UBA9226]
MKTVLTTTGISLLTNVARELKKSGAAVTDEELRFFLQKSDPVKATAETNSLLKIAQTYDEIIFLYTATAAGERCAKEIERYLQKQGWLNIRLRQLPLGSNESHFERQGLRDLVNILIDEITKAQREKREVIINATGGFKAEIAYTTLVGMIFEVPIKYIYQEFDQPITLPVLPISWNIDLLLEYESFFEWLDGEPRQEVDVNQRLKAMLESDRNQILQILLPPDGEGYIFLSPAGEILWKRVAQQRELAELVENPPPSDIAVADKIADSIAEDKHHYPKGTLAFAQKLAKLDAVEEIIGGNFEPTLLRRVKRVDDDGTIRVLWADNEKANNMTIRTTARGKAQTLRFCDRYVRPLLNS